MKPIKFAINADGDDVMPAYPVNADTGKRTTFRALVAQANLVPELVAMLRLCVAAMDGNCGFVIPHEGCGFCDARALLARFEETK